MNTAIARSSKAIKGSTSTVRMHLDAVERAREIYLAAMKRLEADYFERINRATEILTGSNSETTPAASEQPPAPEQSPAPVT
jgi:hypothetical protein